MELKFDGGTILFKALPDGMAMGGLPGIRWDDRVESYRAPAYLLGSIVAELNKLGCFPSWPVVPAQSPSLKPSPVRLRPYQQAALDAWEVNDYRGVVVLPTGAGKTLVATSAIRNIGRSTLILVPTRVLLQQWACVLEKESTVPIGVLGDGERRIAPVTIATFESAFRHMSQIGNRFEFVIVDEVHHFGSGVRDEALEMSLARYRLGLTATTPDRESWFTAIGKLVGPVVYQLDIHDLRGSFLADFDVIRLHVELDPPERGDYERHMALFRHVLDAFRSGCPVGSWTDFTAYAARSEAGREGLRSLQRAKKILHFPKSKQATLSRILKLHQRDRVLIFAPDTATVYEIAKAHLVMPLTAEISRQEREDAMRWFREGAVSKLVSCQVLNEGFDVPGANVAIILGGRGGEREHLQRVGRVLRKKESGKHEVSEGQKAKVFELVCARTVEVRQSNRRGQKLDPTIPSFT